MPDIDTSPAALRALAEQMDDVSLIPAKIGDVACDTLRALADEKEAATVKSGLTVGEADQDAMISTLRANLAGAEQERDALRLAILGGEDAPGYATTVSIDDVISTLEDGRRLYRYCAEKAEAERGKLIMALDHLLYPKPASGTRVYTLPDGQRECLTAKQFHEACARHLLQTLATQDLLAMAPGVKTAPANPEGAA